MEIPIEPLGKSDATTAITDFPAFRICGRCGSGKTRLIEHVVGLSEPPIPFYPADWARKWMGRFNIK